MVVNFLLLISLGFVCLYLVLDSLEIILNQSHYGFDSPITINKYYLRKIYNHKLVYNLSVLSYLVWIRLFTSLFLYFSIYLEIYWLSSIFIIVLIVAELYLRLRCVNRLSSSEHIIMFNLFCYFCYFVTLDTKILHFISLTPISFL